MYIMDKVVSMTRSQIAAIGMGEWLRHSGRFEDLSIESAYRAGLTILNMGWLAAPFNLRSKRVS